MIDGILVPSVTTLVAYATGDIYKNIPEAILEKARIRGTGVHDSIEYYEKTGDFVEEYADEIHRYIELKRVNNLNKVKDMEQIVHYKHYYCGRYDILDENGILWDIKATAKYHQENLEWQLGLYYLALGKEITSWEEIGDDGKPKRVSSIKGYCIHLPRNLTKAKVYLVEPRSTKECIDLIETYESSKH